MKAFRDQLSVRRSSELVTELEQALAASRHGDESSRLCALLLAGELECALSDAAHPAAVAAAALTDELARACARAPALLQELRRAPLPEELRLRRPEGYAYYGLDPRSYARAALAAPLGGACAVVIGVRSIGSSLSAMFCAGLERRGVHARRLTVRPGGPPWSRTLTFSDAERAALRARLDADVFVVDEGPGLSGSTFLAVAEAVHDLGVPEQRIVLCTSHAADPQALTAPDASARWSRFRVISAPPPEPRAGMLDLSASAWRTHVFASAHEWPACWASLERRKWWSADRRELWKFEGFAPYDRAPLARAEVLTAAGFAPAVRRAEDGFAVQRWCPGRPARPSDRARALATLASYAACRARELPAAGADQAALEAMARENAETCAGVSLPKDFSLPLESPVYADGRMLPHEWRIDDAGVWQKLDGIDHGDDHLFPGPTDIAWDLAGAVVEWDLDSAAAASLTRHFARLTGDDAAPRLGHYVMAYSAFRLGCLAMARLRAEPEELPRIERATSSYRARLRRAVGIPASM